MNSKLRDIFAEYYHRWVKYGYYGNPEKLDQDTEFNQFEKAIRQAVGEEVLELLSNKIAIVEIPDFPESRLFAEAYSKGQAFGLNEAVDQMRQKIKQWQGGAS